MTITSRMPREEYDLIPKLNISRLKHIKRSPLKYRHEMDNPTQTEPMVLGVATHVAVLEPERYARDFAVWDRITDGGNSAPRRGQYYDAFAAANKGKTVLTLEQHKTANAIARAVRFNEAANKYLETGDPEVTLEWVLAPEIGSRPAKSRLDWLTRVDGRPCLVGLKTTRDCRHFKFASQAASLGYHLNWAYYFDAYVSLRGGEVPKCVEIVVESEPPHDVAVYRIDNDIITQGREEYWECAKILAECERADTWPGCVPVEEALTLPSWVYKVDEDLDGLDLVGADD